MQLEKISTVVRPRGSWEAIDLGMIMARAWYGPLLRAWLAVTLPVLLVLGLLLHEHPLWVLFIMWWFKPWWERAPLHILSYALFGEQPGLRQTLRAFPGLLRGQWFSSISWRRLTPSRSMNMPVMQLEQLKGKAYAERLRVLHGRRGTGSGWLTITGAHIEAFLPLALLTLILMFLPSELEIDWLEYYLGGSAWVNWFYCGAGYLAMALAAPFYVAGGFSLYLNRRIWLEGWDIELIFRRLRQRIDTQNKSSVKALAQAAMLMLALFIADLPDSPLLAQETAREQSKAAIEEVMDGESFHQREMERTLDWDWFDWDFEPDAQTDTSSGWLVFFEFLAANVRILLWAIVIATVFIVLFKRREWLQQFLQAPLPARAPEPPPPVQLFGLEVGAHTLPRDVMAEVQRLWRQQKIREAYALLYRATLSRLMEQHKIAFRDGNTEGECLELVEQRVDSSLAHYFAELTRHWQRLAYAHQAPSVDRMEGLCRQWADHFLTARGPAHD